MYAALLTLILTVATTAQNEPSVVVFAEPGFPARDVPLPLVDIPGALSADSVVALGDALQPGRVLVWRHGSTFPADAWEPLISFLEAGGAMVVLGGEPFTRPVVGEAGQRHVQPRTVAMLKTLRLNQCQRLASPGSVVRYLDWPVPEQRLAGDAWVATLEPRFSDTRDFAHEDGAPGARDAILTPLAFVHRDGADPRFPMAAAAFRITRLRGRFAGGQWVFRLLSTPPSREALDVLIREAARPAVDLRVDPTFGCFHAGEQPSVNVRLHRPGLQEPAAVAVELSILHPDGHTTQHPAVQLPAGRHASARVTLSIEPRPGLYRVLARTETRDAFETGFWVFDPALFRSGDELTFDGHTMRRNGVPEPIIGTTTMSADVHRKFLYEPNAAVWDDTFRELASLDINFVRTGMWSGFRKISLDPHVVDEAWLRALEAYYLSARQHGIPILFSFFAFVPESFGGDSPYFDPRSIEGQQAYLSAVASRFADAREMLWDFINEPSFASPDKLWVCRPHGGRHEEAAFLDWLKKRFSGTGPGTWEDTVRARWRLRPDEAITLPSDADFEDRTFIGAHRPYRAKAYLQFAQDAFGAWMRHMTRAIREGGSRAPITVGQDEGGLTGRPSPLLHHHLEDYTSMHTWWFNDHLLWDGVMAKAPDKALLISETGVMTRELLSGETLRAPQTSAALLSRKIAYAFAGRACGAVQWCYEVNPYMDSDNEVAIGLKRVDGSYKPEHAVLSDFAAFVDRVGQQFVPAAAPEVAVVWPTADLYGPREFQTRGMRRAVGLLVRELGVAVQVVAEPRCSEDLGQPRLIVLPACRGLSDRAWAAIRAAVESGSVLLCSGWFETDDAGLPVERLGFARRRLQTVEPLDEFNDRNEPAAPLRYPLEVTHSWYCARREALLQQETVGRGAVWHFALPLEWAEDHDKQRDIYIQALQAAGVKPQPPRIDGLYAMPLRNGQTLLSAVNETSRELVVPHAAAPDSGCEAARAIPPGFARLYLLNAAERIVDCTSTGSP